MEAHTTAFNQTWITLGLTFANLKIPVQGRKRRRKKKVQAYTNTNQKDTSQRKPKDRSKVSCLVDMHTRKRSMFSLPSSDRLYLHSRCCLKRLAVKLW